MTKLLPLLAIMALLLALVSLASAQEATTDTSSDPDLTADPPVALQQNGLVKLADNTDEVDDEADGLVVGFVAGDPGTTPPSAASYRSYAVSFTTGGDAGWYQLVEVGIATKVTGTPLARLSIHRDHEGSPHAEALYVTHFRGASEEAPDLYLEFPDNTPLDPNQTYWAVFEEVSGLGVYEISTAPNDDEDPDSWPISDTSLQRNFFSLTGRTWQASALNPIAIIVDGYPIEERVLVGAHGLRDTAADGPFLRFGTERVTKAWLKLPMGQTFDFCEPAFVAGSGTERSWRLCDLSPSSHHDHEWAGGRGFTTGPNPTGYTISGLGVDIDAQSGTLDPVADIYAAEAFSSRKGARDPQSPLASYQATAGIGGSPDRFAPRTAVSEKLHVEPGRTYVAYFQNAAAGYYQTPNARAGQDAGAEDGWTLGYPYGSKFIHPLGFAGDSWNFRPGDSKRIPLNIHGWPNPLPAAPNPAPPPPGPVLVSTLGQPSNPTSQLVGKRINLEIGYAASFTNGNDAVHTLHGVQIEVTVIPPLQVLGAIRASIYSDGGGEPGVALYELGLRANPQVGVLTFDAPADTTLAANTTFWLVIDIAHSPTEDFFRTAVTSGTGQDACAIRDWSIGDVAYFREGPGAAWSPNADLLKMAVLGEPASSPSAELGEPACDDLPGDTTTTGRLVVDGDGVKGQHASARDADWYAVSLDAGVDYQFDVVDAPPVYLLKIHDDQGTELRTSAIAPVGDTPYYQHPNRVNSLPFRTDQADTYYVSIASPKGGHAPDRVYTLSAQSDDHPADTTTTAVAELGELTRVYLMRTSSDPDDTATNDVDWVRASLLANVRYHISFDVGKCPQTAVIEGIHDADGTAIPMTSSSKACSASMYFTPPTKGDYYIAVTGKGSQFVDKEDVDADGRLKGTYHDRYPFIGADAVLVVSLVVNYCTGESLDTLRDALTPLSEPSGGDLPAGTSASSRVPIGSSVTGNIESATDRDWFRVRFNGRKGERVYWLELKGADTGDGTLPDPLIVGIYDRQGNYIPFSHVAGQFKTYDNDSGYGRNAITDFTAPCAGDYFVAVAGYEGPTGSYTLSVTDITDTSTSIPADDYEGKGFANWQGFDGPFDGTSNGDELVGNLAPGLPATAPVYETDYELFRLSVLPGRNYRVEVRLPETTGGEPADVDVRLLLGLHPYSDLGRADPEDIVVRHVTDETDIPGDPSIEFTGTRTWYFSARGFVETVVPSRWLASVDILSGEYFEPGDVYTIVLTDITDSGDDYLGAEETTGAVTVGGNVTGNLEVDNDVDSFRVRLEADKSYRIRMRGSESGRGTLADPYVSIVATSPLTQTEFGVGTPINFNNDRSETEKDSELVVTVYSSKDYLILAASPGTGTGTYTIEVEEVTTSMGQRANSPATGGPGITGTVQAGETLTATTDGIEDEDGLTGTVFAYQWVRSDTDIEGAISSTYTMTDDDEGKAIKVRVTFSDDAGNEESLTSYARLSAPPLPPAQRDDDGPAVVVSFGSAAHSVIEGSKVKVGVEVDPERTVTVPPTVKDQGGASPADYSGVPASVTFNSGEISKTFTFSAAHSVTEGGTVEVTVTLDVDPERTVTVPLTVTDQDGASPADYSGVPASVTFDSGEISKTFTFSATQDDVDDDGESVKLAFGTPPPRVSAGTVNEFTVNIQDDDDPAVAVSFGSAAHSVTEGGTVEVTVTLDVDPERTVTVPLTVTDQDGASPADYSGVPASVTFDSGEISKTFTFSATQDDVDDDGESVKLAFGTPPPRVSAGTVNEFTVNIQDDDDPAVAVSFGSAAHSVTEGGTVEVTVTVDVDPERTVTVPLTVTDQDGASPADYSGVPTSVTFDSGEVLKTFTFSATQDDVDDDGESVKLAFGTPPPRVSAGTVNESTVNIQSKPPLTASVESAPTSHNGSDEFRIRIALSEEPKTGFSYKIMRDHAFTVTGGSVTGARRLEPPSNTDWEVVVKPDSNGDVTIVLPITTDCDAQGAICTGDGRPLSNWLKITVLGPSG